MAEITYGLYLGIFTTGLLLGIFLGRIGYHQSRPDN